jgi:hypothetical protein
MVRLNQRSKRKRNGEKAETISRDEFVVIEWLDAYEMASGWQTIEEAQKIKPPTIFSVGFILKECPEYTIIAGDLGRIGDSDCGRVQVIPGQWIKKKLQVK